MGEGLRPDEKGVLRYTQLFQKVFLIDIKNPGPHDQLLHHANRLLFKCQLDMDKDKKDIDSM